MRWYSEDNLDALLADPRWPTACELAHQLWGLTDEEWDWCWDDAVRATALNSAVQYLGLGNDERQGTESFLEAPGDDPAEYTQACRFAFRFWRTSAVGTDPGPGLDSFVAVDANAARYCGDHPSRVTQAAQLLQIDAPLTGQSVAARLAQARACSFAASVAIVDELPLATPGEPTARPTAGEAFTLEALFINHGNTEVLITEAVGGSRTETLRVPACGAVRINGESRSLPWSLGYSAAALPDARPLTLMARDDVDAQGLRVVVTIDDAGAASAEEMTTAVPDLPAGGLCNPS